MSNPLTATGETAQRTPSDDISHHTDRKHAQIQQDDTALPGAGSGYIRDVYIDQDRLAPGADYYTLWVDFCFGPEARAGEQVAVDLGWETPFTQWTPSETDPELLTAQASLGSLAVDSGVSLELTADTTDLSEGFPYTVAEFELQPEGVTPQGRCGQVRLPIPAPAPDVEDYAYEVEFYDHTGAVFTDEVLVKAGSDWQPGQPDFAAWLWWDGTVQWGMLTPAGPAGQVRTDLSGVEAADSTFSYFSTIIDSGLSVVDETPAVTHTYQPHMQTKSYSLGGGLARGQQLAIQQEDSRQGLHDSDVMREATFAMDGRVLTLSDTASTSLIFGRYAAPWTEPTPQPQCIASFTDNPPGSSFYESIQWMACNEISVGYPDGTFRKTKQVSRGETAQFIYKLVEPQAPATGQSPFSDVGKSFRQAILWFAAEGISVGYADGTFRPTRPVTRGEFAQFLYKLTGSDQTWRPPARSPFTDMTPSSPHYAAITWLEAMDITSGYTDGTFKRSKTISRAETAAFLYRLAG